MCGLASQSGCARPNLHLPQAAAGPKTFVVGRRVSAGERSERLLLLKCEMRFWCFRPVETVLCIFGQKILVRKLFVLVDPTQIRQELFVEN
jgi:hypothetical protein